MWPHSWIRFAGLRALHLEDLGRSAIYSSAAHLYASATLEVCLSLKAKWVMAPLPMLPRLALDVEVEVTTACQPSHTNLVAQHPTSEAFLDPGLVLGSLRCSALGCFEALTWPAISDQALLWVNVPLEATRIVTWNWTEETSPLSFHGFSHSVKHRWLQGRDSSSACIGTTQGTFGFSGSC